MKKGWLKLETRVEGLSSNHPSYLLEIEERKEQNSGYFVPMVFRSLQAHRDESPKGERLSDFPGRLRAVAYRTNPPTGLESRTGDLLSGLLTLNALPCLRWTGPFS
ncbi:hypothetical protein M569_00019 [Genlisea aurea]|uniref:Uncharacterized protein n=1 Tax=Genlisea aurea TaxID=192259 RepID=S8D4Q4_9LAMI|nr:hypothetical protein M569_00019 [Genlisea aurea]